MLRYVDDPFVVRPNGHNSLDVFPLHLKGLHKNIQFTMEMERPKVLPFKNLLVLSKRGWDLGMERLPDIHHTDLYLTEESFHHPVQKWAALSTLI